MLRKPLLLVLPFLIGTASVSASTLFLSGASGIPDMKNESSLPSQHNGCLPDASTGSMYVVPYTANVPPPHNNDCLMSYAINLPVGSTIDGVEIAYRDDSGSIGKSIVAYLGVNRIKPYLGPIAVGGTSDSGFGSWQQQTANMGSLSLPIEARNIYWVQVHTHFLTEVDYVAVTYH
jgi:hypothetical protein